MIKPNVLRSAAGIALLSLSGLALAHNPMCQCEEVDAENIRCTGGFPMAAAPLA